MQQQQVVNMVTTHYILAHHARRVTQEHNVTVVQKDMAIGQKQWVVLLVTQRKIADMVIKKEIVAYAISDMQEIHVIPVLLDMDYMEQQNAMQH